MSIYHQHGEHQIKSWANARFNKLVKGQEIRFRSGASIRNELKMIINPQDVKSALFSKNIVHIDSFMNSEVSLLKFYLKNEKYTISSKGFILRSFHIFINFLIVYSVISNLLDIAFETTFKGQELVNYMVWTCFVIDFILNFITEQFDSRGRSIRNIKLLAGRYIKGWFIVDFLAILPLGLMDYKITEKLFSLGRVLKIKKIFAMIKIQKLIKYFLKNYKKKSIAYKKTATMIKIVWEFIIEVFSVIFFSFFTACIFYYFCNYLIKNNKVVYGFIIKFELDHERSLLRLIKTMYFIFTSMATVGFGDFYPANIYEMGFISFILFFSTVWFTVSIGKSLEFIKRLSRFKKKSENADELELFIASIERKRRSLPYTLKSSLFSHFAYFWSHSRIKNSSMKHIKTPKGYIVKFQDKILDEIPDNLKKQIYQFLYDDIFMLFKFFFPRENNFMYKICEYFQPRYYGQDTIILKENEFCDEVIFITKGKIYLGFYSNFNGSFVPCKLYDEKPIIGDYTLLFNRPSFATFSVPIFAYGMSILRRPLEYILKNHYKGHFNKLKEKVGIRCLNLLNLMTSHGYTESESQIYGLKEMLKFNSIDMDEDKKYYKVYKFCEEVQESLQKMKQAIHKLKFEIITL